MTRRGVFLPPEQGLAEKPLLWAAELDFPLAFYFNGMTMKGKERWPLTHSFIHLSSTYQVIQASVWEEKTHEGQEWRVRQAACLVRLPFEVRSLVLSPNAQATTWRTSSWTLLLSCTSVYSSPSVHPLGECLAQRRQAVKVCQINKWNYLKTLPPHPTIYGLSDTPSSLPTKAAIPPSPSPGCKWLPLRALLWWRCWEEERSYLFLFLSSILKAESSTLLALPQRHKKDGMINEAFKVVLLNRSYF